MNKVDIRTMIIQPGAEYVDQKPAAAGKALGDSSPWKCPMWWWPMSLNIASSAEAATAASEAGSAADPPPLTS